MAFKCVLIDDEPLALQVLTQHLKQIDDFELLATFQNPLEAFEVLKTTKIDLLFLDIQMPLLTGIDFVKALQSPPAIIFTTAYRDYAIESYELEVVDYLLKPITFARFYKAVNKFKNLQAKQPVPSAPVSTGKESDHIYVNANKKFIKVAFDQILYVESIKDYIRIHTLDKNIITKDKISEFETKLPQGFLRIHRSFIVNTNKITAFTSLDVEIGAKEIPIGSSYKKEILSRLKNIK